MQSIRFTGPGVPMRAASRFARQLRLVEPPTPVDARDPESGRRIATADRTRRFDESSVMPPLAHAGRYELLVQTARGGMGALWAARLHLACGFERRFAVKTMLPKLAHDPILRRMWLDEARLTAGITHPNVVEVLDAGEDDGVLFIVMEWIEGTSLHALARGARRCGETIPLGVALRTVVDACRGLHAAHEHRATNGRRLDIVHRDVSPENLMVTVHGVTKVIDFGIARSRDSVDLRPGEVVGKPLFMSPERARAEVVDCRADVWSLGVVLYKVLTGGYPYPGQCDTEILLQLTTRKAAAPLPRSVPRPIRQVIERALSLDVEQRYPSALALAEDLEAAAAALGVTCGHQDVAAYVERVAGERIAEQRDAIRATAEDGAVVSTRIWIDEIVEEPSPPPLLRTMPPILGPADVIDAETVVSVPRGPRWVGRFCAAVLAGAAAAGAAAALLFAS